MTHEFKTPIATINLALDSIKNPKILNDTDKVLRYVQMIRDENNAYQFAYSRSKRHNKHPL